ncbi:pentatricopeptide repeat-containing protein At5g04780, mitochondrial-like isoform X1 [Prosopis cineraria]|uniref:pentatricopeptide repeat-containing protein At5g04780, mitochondrial-like isoform X1 n=2 Tax=Prosopis cineraria TaxID=364024 RepID=UPI0024106E35|nr:pentatricopeptide repeat-containing protein At5g04780, mitochondrial-like isoform X1 [Prosopis cineraria]XP_054780639.1 pentatricopeptide repeat-containing protein At5g04780, mitochondrial-like isoform X1 [Prosopis cineraria]XP_054780640.1 pentatricopeptide repeat-containing protein At5g04780, mitochondrial-like isoform X1 [Prosopis cineraria]XP_054780642.1 pentatricopeptide repeat-containing protein At5g04780, mitochondrial-like isoform X1 [Prosopis cineraria]XP_054780643.1 pentatricopeptid
MSQKGSFLSSLLRSCLPHFSVWQAKQCHAQIFLQGLLPNVTLETDLLLVYSRYRFLHHARQVFDGMLHKNMHSWNIIIASYAANMLYSDAIAVFYKFQRTGLRPDHFTLPPLFKASTGVGDTSLGKKCHALVIKLGYEEYVVVGSCVLESYAKSGAMSEARCVFSNMSLKDSVVWNLMISGFARTGLHVDALSCLREMILNEVKIESMVVPSVLNACGREGDLIKGKEVHGHIVKGMFNVDAAIGNALIDMYGKCGCLNYSEKVFKTMTDVNLVTWTAMISSYGMHGKGEESLFLFKKMIDIGFTPNQVTLTAILASCSHSGLVDQGMQIFNSVHSEYRFEPSVEHYACIVDLLGRCGYLVEALQILESMKSSATASIWGALLAGCMMHKNVKIGKIAARHLFQIEPNNASNYIALCSIYESHGMLEAVSSVRAKLRNFNLVKAPGCSWINIAGRCHKFYQGELSHSLAQMIHEILLQISNPEMTDDCDQFD